MIKIKKITKILHSQVKVVNLISQNKFKFKFQIKNKYLMFKHKQITMINKKNIFQNLLNLNKQN